MYNSDWIPGPEILHQDEMLNNLVTSVFGDIYERSFADDPLINHRLPIEIRALRDVDDWRVFLLLTPWMLSRVYVRSDEASINVPPAWQVENRINEPYLVVGPQVGFCLLEHEQLAHLNFHPELGHYLVQPLILRMDQYSSAGEVYRDWNTVIETRDENMKKRQAECRCQEEISRREFFTRMVQQSDASQNLRM
jgi:hypothetical protein